MEKYINKFHRLFYIFPWLLLFVEILLLDSCVNSDSIYPDPDREEVTSEDKKNVEFTLIINPGIGSRAEEEEEEEEGENPEESQSRPLLGDSEVCHGTEINAIYYNYFEVDSDGDFIDGEKNFHKLSVTDLSKPVKITITLEMKKSYRILFWAQHDATDGENYDSPYTLTNKLEVSVDYSKVLNNDERLDAFYGTLDYCWKDGVVPDKVILRRPFAQVNVGSVIADWLPSGFYDKKFVKSTMTVSRVATKFDVNTGKVVANSSASNVVFNLNNIFEGPTQDMEYLEPEEIAKLSFKRGFLYVDFNGNGKIDKSIADEEDEDELISDEEEKESISGSSAPLVDADWWRYERTRYISMIYFLVDSEDNLKEASDVVNLDYQIGYYNEMDQMIFPFSGWKFDNVSVKPNYRANIVGSIFTKQQRIYVNLSPLFIDSYEETDNEVNDNDSWPHPSFSGMDNEAFNKMLAAFNSSNFDDINKLFAQYGVEKDGNNYFVLGEDVINNQSADNVLTVRWDYILYGKRHTVKVRANSNGNVHGGKAYYNMGPVRNIYITDLNGGNRIYIDEKGWIYIPDELGVMMKTSNQLYPLTGEGKLKSYDVCASTGEIAQSDYYPGN